jgi:hypothetical protein
MSAICEIVKERKLQRDSLGERKLITIVMMICVVYLTFQLGYICIFNAEARAQGVMKLPYSKKLF